MYKNLLITTTLVLSGVCAVAQVTSQPSGQDQILVNSPGELRIRTPLYVINAGNRTLQILPTFTSGIISTGIPDINTRWMHSITFIKAQDAIDQYGELGRQGVVVVELKDDALAKMPPHVAERFKEK